MIRILLVDDAPFVRMMVSDLLSEDPQFKVIAEAEDGETAIRYVPKYNPDLLIIDVQMPGIGGLKAIETIMSNTPVPILVLTGQADQHTAFEALSRGALEVVDKADFGDEFKHARFLAKVELLSRVPVEPLRRKQTHTKRLFSEQYITTTANAATSQSNQKFHVIAIASSTGGPKALETVLAHLDSNILAAIVIAQHINADFQSGLVEWLERTTPLNVYLAQHGQPIHPGGIWLAPSQGNMHITRSGCCHLSEKRSTDTFLPCCDFLLSSVAKQYGSSAIGVQLTGMGRDGAEGIKAIKQAGGVTIAQDPFSAVISSMPAAAIDSGYIDYVETLEEIGKHLNQLT
ncbi:chemotaxis protein CheB [Magnetococcales bacterium HHB-1]